MPFVMLKPDQRARLKPCRRCGYSLRNNIDARNCPECGLAVRISLRDDDALEWSNPAWLRRNAWAMAAMWVIHLGLLAGLLVAVWTRYFASSRTAFWYGLQLTEAIPGIAALLVCATSALLIGGEGRFPDRTFGRRRALLILSPLGAVVAAAGLLPLVSDVPPIPKIRWLSLPLAALVTTLVWCTLREPVRRIPARRCAGIIELLAVELTAGTLLVLLAIGPNFLFRLRASPIDPRMLLFSAGVIAYLLLGLGVLTYCWPRLRSAAREADKNWETDP